MGARSDRPTRTSIGFVLYLRYRRPRRHGIRHRYGHPVYALRLRRTRIVWLRCSTAVTVTTVTVTEPTWPASSVEVLSVWPKASAWFPFACSAAMAPVP